MGSYISDIVDGENRTLANLLLETEIHLHRSRSLKVGREQPLLGAEYLRDRIRIRRTRAQRGVGGLKLLLQIDNRGSDTPYRIAANICCVERVRWGRARYHHEAVGRTRII